MIRYSLKCSEGHSFESWFNSADAFDQLMTKGLVSCAVCGSDEVVKSLMAPGVPAKTNAKEQAPVADTAQTMASGPLTAPGSQMEQALRAFRDKLEEKSTYVGREFADEARRIHLGEVPERQIHGEATADEAKSLMEDGVPVLPLPVVPKERSN